MAPITKAILILSTLLSYFSAVNCSPTARSAVSSPVYFLGNSSKFSLPMIQIPTASKRDINDKRHVFATRDVISAATGLEDEVNIPNTWFVTVEIGTPPQTFLFNPDSGAPDFMVLSTELTGTYSQPLYNASASSTSAATPGSSWATEYGSGQILEGSLDTDIVTVGDIQFDGFSFEIATYDNGLGGMTASGIFGLCYAKAGMSTTPQVQTWFGAVVDYLEDSVFTVDFHSSTETGTIDFGFIDDSKFTGSIGYAPIDTANNGGVFWTVTMDGVQAGSGAFNDTQFDILVDTGTDGGNVPRWIADVYFANFAGSSYNDDWGTYQYPCTEQLIDLNFSAGGQIITIPAEYLGNGCIDSACSICVSQLFTTTGTALWGRPYLEAMFVVFDWGNGQVGFANKNS